MLPIEFFEQNIHFALSLFAALVFFAVFWLYFDAWLAHHTKNLQNTILWVGFLLVSLSFVIYATIVEQTNLGHADTGGLTAVLSSGLRLVGYAAIIVGQILEPLQKKPETHDIVEIVKEEEADTPAPKAKKLAAAAPFSVSNSFGMVFALPMAALAVAALYFRRATTGIERHLRPMSYAFDFLFLFELLSLTSLFRSTSNPALFDLVKAFGPLWILSLICLLVATIITGQWVWKYLTERFLSQLFMTFTSTILIVFLITTVSFTFLLLRSVQSDALNNLETATSVLNYALSSKNAETQADAEAVAANPAVIQAIASKDHKTLDSLMSTVLEDKKLTSLVITTVDAQVLLRAEDPTRWGDSISSDTLVRRALIGTNSSTVTSQNAVLAPVISIRSVIPVRNSTGQIIGTASASVAVDNAFVDGIKHATGLDSAVYSGNVRSATTLTGPDGTSRILGVKETNQDVQTTVLKQGKTFKGPLDILNRRYLAVYAPLKDVDNTVVGMLFIGQPEVDILQTSTYLISLTFVVSVVLLALAILPAYLLARHISHQLE